MIKRHLPHNCHPNRPLEAVDGAVVHFVSDRWRHPDDPYNLGHIYGLMVEGGLSYHVVFPREGSPVEFLPSHLEAWHAGYSRMNGRDYCNGWTRGVALVGHPGEPYTDDQIVHLGKYLAQDMSTHQYTTDWIKGHDEVRRAWNERYPSRPAEAKHDPGELFPWGMLFDMLQGVDLAVRRVDHD